MQVKLIPAVFEHVFSELTTELAVLLEQQILSCQFNQVPHDHWSIGSHYIHHFTLVGWSSAGQRSALIHQLPVLPHQLACKRQVYPSHADSNTPDFGDSESGPVIPSW